MDRDRYAARIDELLADKALAQKLGEHGRQWVGERFGFPKYIGGLEELFARIGAASHANLPAPAAVLAP
jgi:glycosyltransferase involved in cell wall biosynthesis